jgi:uncharacterized protein YodC (DUF2158 family)
MKTVKVYEVGGKLFKNKELAEKEEKELAAQKLEKEKIAQLEKLCLELGVAVPDLGIRFKLKVMKEGDSGEDRMSWQEFNILHAGPSKQPKFKVGDKVRITSLPQGCHYLETLIGEKGVIVTVNSVVYNIVELDGVLDLGVYGRKRLWNFKDEHLELLPENPKFKVGDKVRTKSNVTGGYSNDTGVVQGCTGNNIITVRMDKTGKPDTFFVTALEKIEDVPPKFKVGDRARVKNTCQVEYLRGKTGIIYATDPNGHASSPYQVAEATNYHWYADFDLEKIEDSPQPKFKVGDHVRIKEKLVPSRSEDIGIIDREDGPAKPKFKVGDFVIVNEPERNIYGVGEVLKIDNRRDCYIRFHGTMSGQGSNRRS